VVLDGILEQFVSKVHAAQPPPREGVLWVTLYRLVEEFGGLYILGYLKMRGAQLD
jgi:hypothetical protein